MADDNKLVAEVRDPFGKGAARKIRAVGKIPAVIYGHGTEPQHVTLPGPRDRPHPAQGEPGARARHRGQDPARARQGRAEGPGAPDHRAHRPHRRPQGREGHRSTCPCTSRASRFPGTIVDLDANTLPLEVEATHIPESVVVDVEGLEEGTQILAKDVELPKGSTLITDPETLVVDVTRPPPGRPGRRARRPLRRRRGRCRSRGCRVVSLEALPFTTERSRRGRDTPGS